MACWQCHDTRFYHQPGCFWCANDLQHSHCDDTWEEKVPCDACVPQKALSKGNRTVAVDLDGVILEYDRWRGPKHFGAVLSGAKEFLTELHKFARILIYTTRCCTSDVNLDRTSETPEQLRAYVEQTLKENDLPYDDIYIGQGKPLFACLIDDRAVQCRPQENEAAYVQALNEAKRVCGVVQTKEVNSITP